MLNDLAKATKALDGKKTRQLHQLSCILDSCTISASYEVSEAEKALEKGSSTSLEEHYAIYRTPLTTMSFIRSSGAITHKANCCFCEPVFHSM